MHTHDQSKGCVADVTKLKSNATMLKNRLFYAVKPIVPRSVQLAIRRMLVRRKRALYGHVWPIDERAGGAPKGWSGWPEKKGFALVLMHDVDTAAGLSKCLRLAEIEKRLGFRSSFNFVPERYPVSYQVIDDLKKDGFEVGVHGLKHDGKLFVSKSIFEERAIRINQYLKEWGAEGFSSPSMLHNLDWMHHLNIVYGISTFDTDPFEPQPDGVGTIFPFRVENESTGKSYWELPYTMPQDHSLFIIMKEKNTAIWKQKLDWIAEKGGMALMNSHPDYMHFPGDPGCIEEYPVEHYVEFLDYIKTEYKDQYWNVLPRDLARYWTDQPVNNGKRILKRSTSPLVTP